MAVFRSCGGVFERLHELHVDLDLVARDRVAVLALVADLANHVDVGGVGAHFEARQRGLRPDSPSASSRRFQGYKVGLVMPKYLQVMTTLPVTLSAC
jgi:hypothetical protein